MKKSIKISLGGFAYNIDEDAYAILNSYIQSLKQHLGNSAETDEVVRDIEERASELFSGMVKENESITIEMVNKVVETLGKPEQIADNQDEEQPKSTGRQKRRLYRDPENAVIAGIAGGLGSYFNVDPLVFRILFIVLIFAKGLGIIAYIILWVAVPKAKTVKQRIEMKGEPVNLSNLEKNIREEYEDVKKNLQKQSKSEVADKSISVLSRIFLALGRILEIFIKALGVIIGVSLIGVALLVLIALIASMFFGGLAMVTLLPSFSGLSFGEFLGSTIDMGSLAWASVPIFLIIAIPLISLIYLGIRILFRFRSSDGVFGSIAATVWILSVVTLAVVVFLQARSFTIRESVTEKIPLSLSEKGMKTLTLAANRSDSITKNIDDESIKVADYFLTMIDGKAVIFGYPEVVISKSEGEDFEIILERKARGATKTTATRNAESIKIDYTITDSTIFLSPYFSLREGEKWRMQEMNIIINVPEGMRIKIDNSVEEMLSNHQEYSFCWPDEMVGKTWIMQKNRLVEN